LAPALTNFAPLVARSRTEDTMVPLGTEIGMSEIRPVDPAT
jgi:hypothetical protein